MVNKYPNQKFFIYILAGLVALLPSISFACSYFDDEVLLEQKTTCEKDSSKEWSCDQNRCITTVEAKKDREEYNECLTKTDQTSIKECVDSYAKTKSGNLPNGAEPNHTLAAGANAAFATLMLLNNTAKGQKAGSCMSKMILIGTAAAGVVSELYFRFMAKDKLKELQEKYKADFEFKDPYDAQVKAFMYLKEEQELIAQMANQRKTVYMMLTAGYGAALAMTVFDMFKPNPTCGGGASDKPATETASNSPAPADATAGAPSTGDAGVAGTGGTGATPTGGAGVTGDVSATTGGAGATTTGGPAATAGATGATPTGTTTPASGGAGGPASAGAGMAFGKMMGTAPGIAIVSGIGMGLSMYMWKASDDQKKMALDNSKRISEILEKFQKTLAGFCPNGRNDLANPRCYCYNQDNTANNDRSKSETCNKLWDEDKKNFFVAATDYGIPGANSTKSGCMNIKQEFDADCNCKKMTNAKGENACLKVPVVSTVQGLDSMINPSNLSGVINGINNGTFSPANLNQSGVQKLAIGANKAKKSILPALQKAVSQNGKPIELNNALLDGAIRSIPSSARDSAYQESSMPLVAAARSESGYLADELKKAEAQAGLEQIVTPAYSDAKKDLSPTSNNKSGYNFDFSDGSGISSGKAGNVESYLDKKYDYKENDIVNRDDISIWSVITNRYNQSGLKRLFEDGENISE